MANWEFPKQHYLTEKYKEIAQEIVDTLVKYNLSNVEMDLILECVSYRKNFLRVTDEYRYII